MPIFGVKSSFLELGILAVQKRELIIEEVHMYTLKTSFVVGAEHLSGSDVRLRSQTSDWTLHYGGRD